MSARDGGPATCGKRGCDGLMVRRQGHQNLCAKHYRFGQMRATARRDGKVVPTAEQLDNVFSWDGLTCRDCKRPMNWLRADGADSQITLQHCRSGSMGFVCLSCNTRHAAMPGDTYCDMPQGFKFCPNCKSSKPQAEFCKDNSRNGVLKLKSWCRPCSGASHANWRASRKAKFAMLAAREASK